MTNTKQQKNLSQRANNNLKECWWMQAGVVDYKLCDRDYDCEHCQFDQALHGREATSFPASLTFITAGPMELERTRRVRKSQKEFTRTQGSEVARALFYHPAHIWARIEHGGCVRTGLDDFAQRLLGRPYLVTLPEPGTTLNFGEGCWRFTHQYGDTVFVAPVSGTVKEINPVLRERPTLLNRDPYGAGWVLLIEPTDLKSSLKRLLYGPMAVRWYGRDLERLYEKVNELNRADFAGPTLNDGGSLNENFRSALTAVQLRQVIDYFFPLSLIEKAETNKAILVNGGGSW